jgi:hypothetical protein
MPAASFKELMGQLKADPTVQMPTTGKKELADHYNFTEGWYDALLNSDYAIANNNSGQNIHIDPAKKRQIVEIGVYEGASSCFWSDFYLDHEESSLISIDPFTGSEEHLRNPEKYAGLSKLERTARENIAKSKNCGKIEIIKGLSQHVYADLSKRFGDEPWIDLLYIDGAHDSVSVARDIILYVPMVKPGGIVFFDDYAHPDVKRAVDMSLNAFAQFELAMFTGWQLVGKVSEVANKHGDAS